MRLIPLCGAVLKQRVEALTSFLQLDFCYSKLFRDQFHCVSNIGLTKRPHLLTVK